MLFQSKCIYAWLRGRTECTTAVQVEMTMGLTSVAREEAGDGSSRSGTAGSNFSETTTMTRHEGKVKYKLIIGVILSYNRIRQSRWPSRMRTLQPTSILLLQSHQQICVVFHTKIPLPYLGLIFVPKEVMDNKCYYRTDTGIGR